MTARQLVAVALAVAPAGLFASDWPQFRGPDRDGVSKETGLLKEWPEGGPPLAWTATGLGGGYSSVSVAGDRVYTLGNQKGNMSHVVAIDPPQSPQRKLPERARYSWSPDGRQLLFVQSGTLKVLPAAGGDAKPWRPSLTAAVSEPVWAPDGSRFAALVADPSVADPELETVKAGMYTTAQPFMDVYLVSADGAAWTLVGQDSVSMSANALVGLAVSSHDTTTLASATFDQVN